MNPVIDRETSIPLVAMKRLALGGLTVVLLVCHVAVSAAAASASVPPRPKVVALMTAQAGQAFKEEDYARAVQLFREVTEINPKDAASWRLLGQSLARTNDVKGAQQAFAKVLELQPKGQAADSIRDMLAKLPPPDLFSMKIDTALTLGDWMPLADDQVRQGKRKLVLEKIRQYLAQFGPVPQLLALQAKLQQEIAATIKVDDTESAQAALPQIRELKAQTPDNLDVLRLEARACHVLGDFTCAEAAYSSWLNGSAKNHAERKEVVGALMQARQHQAPDKLLYLSNLGLTILGLSPEQAASLGLGDVAGALIHDVEQDSPADKAEIKAGDVILGFDGKPINSLGDLSPIVADIGPGRQVLVRVWRGGANKELSLTLGERSAVDLAAKTEQAAQAFVDADYALASVLFGEVALINVRDDLVWHFLGQALAKTHDLMGARRAYARVLEIKPDGKLAESTRELLAALPAPDLFALPLNSGITLGDWMKLLEKQSGEARRESLLHDIPHFLNTFGPVPQLLALQEKLQQELQGEQNRILQKAIATIKLNNADTAAVALPKIRQLKAQAAGNLTLTRLEARACHLMQDFPCAEAAYAEWLKAASGSDLLRDSVIASLMQAKRRETLPPLLVATGEIIRDCPYCPEMVIISKGSFEMGDVNLKRTVSFAQSFAIGKTEVTQGQWKAVMGGNPSRFPQCGDNCPVDNVNWDDANEFARRLSVQTGKPYRLPSEAEWEAACRAGEEQEYCGSDSPDSAAWYGAYAAGNSGKATHPVAAKQPNAWGFYDMSGNVKEWVADSWHDSLDGAPTNGGAWRGDGARHVVRGGSWVSKPKHVSAAHRDWDNTAERYYFNGFRLARTLP